MRVAINCSPVPKTKRVCDGLGPVQLINSRSLPSRGIPSGWSLAAEPAIHHSVHCSSCHMHLRRTLCFDLASHFHPMRVIPLCPNRDPCQIEQSINNVASHHVALETKNLHP